ncbi:hypothetical protein HMI49_24225 [Corallococcus exercitus]|uniref:Pre-toxin TG domain-containing protein n=1 Tax=Corallococcus exercitus TaxID=2316736 RepID=A0A7Y4KM75_9BACT|nr:hypothetical protein [Corallococcus exercitus]NOK36316.1 hypothetical protein [Corallococcus exercitus]
MLEGTLGRFSASLMLVLAFTACGTPGSRTLPVGMHGYGRYHSASPASFARDTAWRNAGSGGTVGGEELGRYLAFIREKRAALKQPAVMEVERQVGHAALNDLLLWASARTEEELAKDEPLEVYLRLKAQHAEALLEDGKQSARAEAKLEEFHRWADARRQALAEAHFRRLGSDGLLTESPLYEEMQLALLDAVLDWAYTHTEDPDFPRKSPSEVALYLLARDSLLASAVEASRFAPPTWDPAREPPGIPPEEVVLEIALGLLPVTGEVADVGGVVLGQSLLGYPLTDGERLLCAVSVALPVVSGRLLSEGAQGVERVALLTGRSLREVQVLQRVVQHLSPQEAQELRRVLRAAGRGEAVSAEDVERLRALAKRLEAPLAEAGRVLAQGKRVALVGSRATAEGARLVPGSAEHLAQAWVDYQFRHPEKYRSFRYVVDPEWERLYQTVIKNKGAGSAFEQSVLQSRKLPKNSSLLMPPPGSKAEGFIPDAVTGHKGDLVWGSPYDFVEVKGRAEMALTGNLKAMLLYVRQYGGSIELWIRSANHAEGATRLTKPLLTDFEELKQLGRANIRYFP